MTPNINDFTHVDLAARRVHHKSGASVVFPAYTCEADWEKSDVGRVDGADHYDGDLNQLIAVAKLVARADGMKHC